MTIPAGVVTAISAIGSVVSAVSAVQQGQVAKSQAKAQSEILRQQAERDRQQAGADEEEFRRRQSRVLAARRAALGAAGVDPGTGSPLLVDEDFAGEVAINALRIRSGGELRATRAEQQASLVRQQGRAAGRAGFVRGGALLLQGTGRAFASR